MEGSEALRIGLFLLPLKTGDIERDGLVVKRAPMCSACAHQDCLKTRSPAGYISLCREGVNYVVLSSTALARGFLVDEWEPPHGVGKKVAQAFKRNRRALPNSRVPEGWVRTLALPLIQTLKSDEAAVRENEERVFRQEYERRNFEDWAKSEIRRELSGLSKDLIHDLMQFVVTISHNINFVLAQRYGDSKAALGDSLPTYSGRTVADPRRVWKKEKAVFYTCELLRMRLRFARAFIDDSGPRLDEWQPVSPHRMFTKMVHLYDALAEDREVEIALSGECRLNCVVPYDTFHIPVLALIDNAVKYAPPHSKVRIKFDELGDHVVVSVASFGPQIQENERSRIFTAGYRGQAAKEYTDSGAGLGLWQARRAVEGWGSIEVAQESAPSPAFPGFYATEFEFRVPRDGRRAGTGIP